MIASGQGFLVPAIDEFGGYSSRLRIPEILSANGGGASNLDQDTSSNDSKKLKKPSKKQAQKFCAEDGFGDVDNKSQANQNLC